MCNIQELIAAFHSQFDLHLGQYNLSLFDNPGIRLNILQIAPLKSVLGVC